MELTAKGWKLLAKCRYQVDVRVMTRGWVHAGRNTRVVSRGWCKDINPLPHIPHIPHGTRPIWNPTGTQRVLLTSRVLCACHTQIETVEDGSPSPAAGKAAPPPSRRTGVKPQQQVSKQQASKHGTSNTGGARGGAAAAGGSGGGGGGGKKNPPSPDDSGSDADSEEEEGEEEEEEEEEGEEAEATAKQPVKAKAKEPAIPIPKGTTAARAAANAVKMGGGLAAFSMWIRQNMAIWVQQEANPLLLAKELEPFFTTDVDDDDTARLEAVARARPVKAAKTWALKNCSRWSLSLWAWWATLHYMGVGTVSSWWENFGSALHADGTLSGDQVQLLRQFISVSKKAIPCGLPEIGKEVRQVSAAVMMIWRVRLGCLLCGWRVACNCGWRVACNCRWRVACNCGG